MMVLTMDASIFEEFADSGVKFSIDGDQVDKDKMKEFISDKSELDLILYDTLTGRLVFETQDKVKCFILCL